MPDDPSNDRPAIRLASPDVGEEELAVIAEVFRSGILTDGPVTAAFEEEFAAYHDVAHAVAFASGTVALDAIYLGLDIGPGDEVVVPSLTFISTATSVRHVGARPVFADVDPDTFNLDPEDVARRLTPRTKAIVTVHYGGQAGALDELLALADDAGIPLIEDAAEAHGATYRGRKVGGIGHAAMFSFTPTKNITTGEGGMVTTDDGALAGRLRLLRNHGIESPGTHVLVGHNWRLTEMQAAMGRVQLTKLDRILAAKRANAAHLGSLLDAIDGVRPPVARADRDHVFMLYTLQIEQRRDAVRAALAAAGIESRLYFPPAHLQPLFAPPAAELPVTEALAPRLLSVPVHARLGHEDLERMAEVVSSALERTPSVADR